MNKPIKDFENLYLIYDDGKVWSIKRRRFLKYEINNAGYARVALYKNDKIVHKFVHRLVAEAFIPNPENKPYVNHKDGVRYNNRIENLEWVTPSENTQHAVDTGLIGLQRSRAVRQYSLMGVWLMSFDSATEASRQTGAQQSKITDCCKGNRRTAGNYQWRYEDQEIESLPAVPIPSCTKKKVAQYDTNNNLIAIYESYKEAARAVNGTSSAISRICSGTPGLHTHKGFVWKIVEDIVQQEIDK